MTSLSKLYVRCHKMHQTPIREELELIMKGTVLRTDGMKKYKSVTVLACEPTS